VGIIGLECMMVDRFVSLFENACDVMGIFRLCDIFSFVVFP